MLSSHSDSSWFSVFLGSESIFNVFMTRFISYRIYGLPAVLLYQKCHKRAFLVCRLRVFVPSLIWNVDQIPIQTCLCDSGVVLLKCNVNGQPLIQPLWNPIPDGVGYDIMCVDKDLTDLFWIFIRTQDDAILFHQLRSKAGIFVQT